MDTNDIQINIQHSESCTARKVVVADRAKVVQLFG